jgi:hypothetical protein
MLARSLSFVVVMLVSTLGAACASSGANSAGPAHPVVPAAPTPPPVPTDPLALVPPDAEAFANIDITAFTQAKDFPTWRAWTERFACISKPEADWLLQNTQRVLVAMRGTKPTVQGLAILAGKYTDTDVTRALSLVPRKHAAIMQAGTVTRHGRFSVTTVDALSATQLEGRLLIMGDSAFVDAALNLIDAPPSTRFADTEPFHRLQTRVACEGRALCAVITPNSIATRALKHALSGAGMKALGKDLSNGATGVSLDLHTGLALATASELRDENEARTVEKQINDWLWQLGVFARLAGFPEVLDEIKVHRASDNVIELGLALDADTLTRLEERIGGMLPESASCDDKPDSANAPDAADDATEPNAAAAPAPARTTP